MKKITKVPLFHKKRPDRTDAPLIKMDLPVKIKDIYIEPHDIPSELLVVETEEKMESVVHDEINLIQENNIEEEYNNKSQKNKKRGKYEY